MKNGKNFVILGLLILSIFLNIKLPISNSTTHQIKTIDNNTISKTVNFVSLPTLTPMSPISISGNSAIPTYATGSGTSADPYIIQLFNFTYFGFIMINIQNTDKPIIIENCYFNTLDYAGGRGISLSNVSDLVIENNMFERVATSVIASGSSNITIKTNVIQNVTPGGYAIFLSNSDLSMVSNNQFFLNGVIGIDLYSTSNSIVEKNYINNSYDALYFADGINFTISQNSAQNSLSDCLVLSNVSNSLIYSNMISKTLTGAGMYIGISHNNVIDGNTLDQTLYGIKLTNSFNNTIANSKITNTDIGIYLTSGSSKNTIKDSSIAGSSTASYGIEVDTQSNWNVFESVTIQNSNVLIALNSSSYNKISDSTFLTGYGNGTEFHSSDYNTITNSIFKSTLDFDVVNDGSDYNHITGNTFVGSRFYSVYISYGFQVAVERNAFLSSSNIGTTQVFNNGMNNIIRFNYWSNWQGPDKNNDGIVDYPLLIDGSAQNYDYYPVTSLSELVLIGTAQTSVNTTISTAASTHTTTVINNSTLASTVMITVQRQDSSSTNSSQSSINTTNTPKTSSGFELPVLLFTLGIISAVLSIRKRRNKN